MPVKQQPKPKPNTVTTKTSSNPTPIKKPKTISKSNNISKTKSKKGIGADEGEEDVDELGNPLPLKNPEGGDPICPGGWKIDYDFGLLDLPNPLFRCISALKNSSDGISKMMNKVNNPASGVTNIANNAIPIKIPGAAGAAGGGGSRRTPRRTSRLRHSKRRKHTTHRRNKK